MKLKVLCISAATAALFSIAGQASATTYTISFDASGFQSAYGQAVPTDPVIGSATVTFDPTQTYYNETAGITLNSINITLDSTALEFDYSPVATTFADTSSVVAGELIIGGAESGAAIVTIAPSSNDFYVHIDNATTAPVMQQLGYSQTATGGASYFYTPAPEAITVTSAVPEPAAWAMMLMGLGALGLAMRSRRKSAQGIAAA
jgi:hypothetical protein